MVAPNMRHAEEADGELLIHLHAGEVLHAARIDGGGTWVGDHPLTGESGFQTYEVHGTYADGEFLCVRQDQIERVTGATTGEEVEFGNRFSPGHPRFADGA